MLRPSPRLPLCALAVLLAAACGGRGDAPAASAATPAEAPAAYRPADGEEAQISLLALLQAGHHDCVEMAVGKRRFLDPESYARVSDDAFEEFRGSDAYALGLRGAAHLDAARELYGRPVYQKLLPGEDRRALSAAMSALEHLCGQADVRWTRGGGYDEVVASRLASYESEVMRLSQHPVAADLLADFLAVHAELITRHHEERTRELRAEQRARDAWQARTAPAGAAMDREQYEREKAEYQRWVAEQERRRAAVRRLRAEREAALAGGQQVRHDDDDEPLGVASSLRSTGPEAAMVLAVRRWHGRYRSGIRSFRGTLIDYEEAPRTAQMADYRRDTCRRLAEVARTTLADPETLACPDPAARRALEQALDAFATAGDRCADDDDPGEQRALRSARDHFRRATEALTPYGVAP